MDFTLIILKNWVFFYPEQTCVSCFITSTLSTGKVFLIALLWLGFIIVKYFECVLSIVEICFNLK